MENRLFDLLRDLNPSFSLIQNDVYHNLLAQGCAFRKFAAAFEVILEEFAGNAFSQKGTGLHKDMGSLTLN